MSIRWAADIRTDEAATQADTWTIKEDLFKFGPGAPFLGGFVAGPSFPIGDMLTAPL